MLNQMLMKVIRAIETLTSTQVCFATVVPSLKAGFQMFLCDTVFWRLTAKQQMPGRPLRR